MSKMYGGNDLEIVRLAREYAAAWHDHDKACPMYGHAQRVAGEVSFKDSETEPRLSKIRQHAHMELLRAFGVIE